MSWEVLVTVFTFGGIGAVVRGSVIFILALPSVFFFPFAVLMINILAAFLGGFIISMSLPQDINSALSIGMIGGLGTLAAFTGDIINHYFDRPHRKKVISLALLYFVLTSVAGVFAAQGGLASGKWIHDYTQDETKQATEQLIMGSQALRESILENSHPYGHEDFLKYKDLNIDEFMAEQHNHVTTERNQDDAMATKDEAPEDSKANDKVVPESSAQPKPDFGNEGKSAATNKEGE